MNAAAPAFDAVPAELLDELGDPLLWFDAGVPAQMSLKGGNAAARQLLALQVGAPARAVLAPLGAELWRWWASQGRLRSDALIDTGDGGSLRATHWTAGGPAELGGLGGSHAERLVDEAANAVGGAG